MIDFEFYNPTEIFFGRGKENQVGEKLKRIGSKVLLHYGSGSIKKTGLYERIIKSLQESGIDYVELGGVVPNPRLSLVYEGINLCREENVDAVLAVGGGSTIDSAKAIALGSVYEGDVWDFFEGKDIPKKTLPVGVVLTIPAAGSETSDSLVITKEEGLFKRSVVSSIVRPKFAILNPELTFTLPFYQTACGVSDMLAHIMERYFTTVQHVDVTDRLCEGLMKSIIVNALKIKNDPSNYDVRAEIMWAGTIAHNDLLGTGRVGDWASHNIEHELSALYDVAHGAGLSIIFPAWMKYQYKVDVGRFVQFSVRVMGVDLPYSRPDEIVFEGIKRLEEFYQSMGLPVRLNEIGASHKDFHLMASKVCNRGNFRKLSAEDIVNIYNLAFSD